MNNKKVLRFLTLSAALLMSSSVFAQNKVALVIGNKAYKDAPLKNSVNDAQDMKAALEKAGFTVIYAENADIDKMDEVREKFVNALSEDSLGLFYYSGHGVQADGINYLIPINAKITSKADLKRRAYDVGYFLDEMADAKNAVNIVILDACRNNPYKGVRSISGGLSNTDAPKSAEGSLIAYATAPNDVADDNQKGRNGLYTKYLKDYLFQPGLTIEDALKKVRQAVVKENPDQIPWENNSLIGDVCLAGCNSSPVISAPKVTYAPLLSFVSGAKSVNQNKSYTVKFSGTDKDGDLSKILVDWGDGSTITAKTAKDSTAVSFSHTYNFAGIYDLIATAIDKQNAENETYSQEVQVKEVSAPAPVVTPPVVVKVPNISNANATPSSIIQGNSVTFNAKLSANLPSGYSVKIDYGSGLTQMNGSTTSFSLSATPTDLGASLFTVGVYDSKGVLKSNQLTGNFSVIEPAPVVIESPKPVVVAPIVTKTTGYTKIANNGSAISDDAKLGTAPTDWACTKDNNTGLIWEVKTDDDGLRDKDWYYSWYKPEGDNGGFAGYTDHDSAYGAPNCSTKDNCNTYAFTNAVNTQGLCGAKDWRLPTRPELEGLIYCSDGKYNKLTEDALNSKGYGYVCASNENTLTTTKPTINTTYFPDIKDNYWFWSSSPYAYYSDGAWDVYFYGGGSSYDYKGNNYFVRLVR
jgi:hypothetical protein